MTKYYRVKSILKKQLKIVIWDISKKSLRFGGNFSTIKKKISRISKNKYQPLLNRNQNPSIVKIVIISNKIKLIAGQRDKTTHQIWNLL